MVRSIVHLAAALTLAVAAPPARAQEQAPETIQDVKVRPYFANGALTGCTIVFDVAQRDELYAGGGAVGLSGSFQVYNLADRQPFAMLKLGYLDMGSDAFVAPSSAYLVNGYKTSAAEALPSTPSEDAGFALFGFLLQEQTSETVWSLVTMGTMTFAYEREGGESGVPVRINLPEGGRAEWSGCIEALFPS